MISFVTSMIVMGRLSEARESLHDLEDELAKVRANTATNDRDLSNRHRTALAAYASTVGDVLDEALKDVPAKDRDRLKPVVDDARNRFTAPPAYTETPDLHYQGDNSATERPTP